MDNFAVGYTIRVLETRTLRIVIVVQLVQGRPAQRRAAAAVFRAAGFTCVEALGKILIRGPYPPSNAIIYMHLHTHTHPFNGPFSGTPG